MLLFFCSTEKDRGGFGVNTYRGLSLSFSSGEKLQQALPTMHLCTLRPLDSSYLFTGVTVFPHWNAFFFPSFFFFFFSQLIYEGCIMASEWELLLSVCIPLGFCSYRGQVNTKSASKYNSLFFGTRWPIPPPPETPSPCCHSGNSGIHRRFCWDASTSVRTVGLGIESFPSAAMGAMKKKGGERKKKQEILQQ